MNIKQIKQEKEQELLALQRVSHSVEQLKQRLETLTQKMESVDEGVESVKMVLSNWDDVRRVISLATLNLAKYAEKDFEDSLPLAEGAVRIGISGGGTQDESGKENYEKKTTDSEKEKDKDVDVEVEVEVDGNKAEFKENSAAYTNS